MQFFGYRVFSNEEFILVLTLLQYQFNLARKMYKLSASPFFEGAEVEYSAADEFGEPLLHYTNNHGQARSKTFITGVPIVKLILNVQLKEKM